MAKTQERQFVEGRLPYRTHSKAAREWIWEDKWSSGYIGKGKLGKGQTGKASWRQ